MSDQNPIVTHCSPPAAFCRTMGRYAQPDGEAKGLSTLTLLDTTTGGGERRAGVMYRRKYGDPGTLLNFCPWCGTNINWLDGERKVVRGLLHGVLNLTEPGSDPSLTAVEQGVRQASSSDGIRWGAYSATGEDVGWGLSVAEAVSWVLDGVLPARLSVNRTEEGA